MYFPIKTTLLTLLVGGTLLTQGCVSTSSGDNTTNSAAMSNLIIAEPLAINFKSEIDIARISSVVTRADIPAEQRAQLFYNRGVLYDSVGLRSLARYDFTNALQLKPDLVDAYNFLGIHYTQLQDFSQAYDSFDAALDLAPEHEYAYFNRGIALYYGSRPELAAQDFDMFHQKQMNDPYRLLWLYLSEAEVDPITAKLALKERAKLVDDRLWAKQIIALYLGEMSQGSFVANLTQNIHSNKELTERLCEAYFYLAKYNQTLGQSASAVNFFKLALSTNVYEFVEHRYARLELDLLQTETVIDESDNDLDDQSEHN